MNVYQIHFDYNGLADDILFYYGSDYGRLYADKETAEFVVEDELQQRKKYDDTIESYSIIEIPVVL